MAVRTPLLDSILREVEALASQLKSDVDVLRRVSAVVEGDGESVLLKDYRPRAEKALQRLVGLLGSELDSQKGNGELPFFDASRLPLPESSADHVSPLVFFRRP